MNQVIMNASLAQVICDSYTKWTGRSLLPAGIGDVSTENALYHWNHVVLAHTPDAIPTFSYANCAAQSLFQMSKEAMIGLPSRESAEAPERSERERLLETVTRQGYIDHYTGVRINAEGVRFRIENATVWNLVDESGRNYGQAATFGEWHYLPL